MAQLAKQQVDPLSTIITEILAAGVRRLNGRFDLWPTTSAAMLEFAARHKIAPQTEHYPMSNVNDAIQHLLDGKARYRIVLDVAS